MSYSIVIKGIDLSPQLWVNRLQNRLYEKSENFNYRRIFLIPTVLLDGLLEITKRPLTVIEKIALVAINLIGFPFTLAGLNDNQVLKNEDGFFILCDKYTFKAVLFNLELAVNCLWGIPVDLLFMPLKIIHQLAFVIFNPENMTPIFNPYNFRP